MQKLFCSLVLCMLAIPSTIWSQNIWTSIQNQSLTPSQNISQRTMPVEFKSFQLTDEVQLKSTLSSAPMRFSFEAMETTVLLPLPMPNGRFQDFKIYESPTMAPKLAEKFPKIKTYTAYGVLNPNAMAKIAITPRGFFVMILSADSQPIFIDPYNAEDGTYISYFKKDLRKEDQEFHCSVERRLDDVFVPSSALKSAGDCNFRQYRLALACTGEYAQFHNDNNNANGDVTADALAAMVVSMARVNGVFEIDAGLTMVLVANNDQIIFTNGATDPYTNGNGFAMLGENQTTCDDENIIGSANYDIGHVYSTGGGGVASLRSPCNNGSKARGVTGQNSPIGDPFDIDYVAHEMGHQWGGNHTQNNSCNSTNASYEPGSASTIMGYAGICNPNVQNNSDAYFHAKNVEEMALFVTGVTGNGNNCATIISTINNNPSANAGADYIIPISTPFVLTGVGSDPDGNPISYCWEQYDNEEAPMPPSSTNTEGPAFRSLFPTTSPKRYFPDFSVVLGGGLSSTWEVLPSVSRDLNFRLTVRDNGFYGCTDEDDMLVSVVASAGPFAITSPNSSVVWEAGSSKIITWDVANTSAPPVSCAAVDILYSTDGGSTFPNVLASNVTNNGSYLATVPAIVSSSVRFLIQCSDNIFYDVSNQNISIIESTGNPTCEQFFSTDTPIAIAKSGTPTVSSLINVNLINPISDINIFNLEGAHTNLGDLQFKLIHPSGAEVILINQTCAFQSGFDINLDDNGVDLSCPYFDNQTAKPFNPLSSFNGLSPNGLWQLDVIDLADQNGGQLAQWAIEICTNTSILPVDFLSFSAKGQKSSIFVEWETANEINNKGFEIQRSDHPERGFEKLGWVNANGGTFEQKYNFEDQKVIPGVIYYYRLKQIDQDGSFSFSPIKSANVDARNELVLQLTPNPVTEKLNVALSYKGAFQGSMQVINTVGQTLRHINFEAEQVHSDQFNLADLSPGVYFLKAADEKGNQVIQRFVKN